MRPSKSSHRSKKVLGAVFTLALLAACSDSALETPAAPELNPTHYRHAKSRDLVALDDHNRLLLFNARNPDRARWRKVRGVRGELLGIDYRPATGELYGLDSADRLYTIDTSTGRATQVSRLNVSFDGGKLSGVDFNPVADRLRVTGANDQNLRINVDTREVTVDGTLAYAEGDVNEGENPVVVASAYTNSFAGTTTTALYDIDAKLNALVLQNPPNDGTLQTVGKLGINVTGEVGFDIVTDGTAADSPNVAYALADGRLYKVNLATGAVTSIGRVSGKSYFGLAVVP